MAGRAQIATKSSALIAMIADEVIENTSFYNQFTNLYLYC